MKGIAVPKFRNEPATIPDWCEVEFFVIVRLGPFGTYRFDRSAWKERLLIVTGGCSVRKADEEIEGRQGDVLDIGSGPAGCVVCDSPGGATLVRIGGHWGDETGSCGVFDLDNAVEHCNSGDPVSYPRSTAFDNHYHDCDEYWIITEGRCIAVSENQMYQLGPGDCLATRIGHHHDIPSVIEPVRGVYFEGSLGGKKRLGHLWEHRDGRAVPQSEQP